MMTLSDTAIREIHARGGRMTVQRKVILAALEGLGGHPTAEEIHSYIQADHPEINLSTVYRNLRLLETGGLVNPRWFEGDRRQQRFDPLVATNHYHFRCQSCGCIIEFESREIEQAAAEFARLSQVEVTSTVFTVYGFCSDCRVGAAG